MENIYKTSEQINLKREIDEANGMLDIVNALKVLKNSNDFKLLYDFYTGTFLKSAVMNITSNDGSVNPKNLIIIQGVSEFMSLLEALESQEYTLIDKIKNNSNLLNELISESE